MKERPILFSGPMVRALLDGTKTQTRRIVKPQPSFTPEQEREIVSAFVGSTLSECVTQAWLDGWVDVPCPYGQPGDRLWVRETWQAWQRTSIEYDEWDPLTSERRGCAWAEWVSENGKPDAIEYRATSASVGPWTPSIHMPRWASRITLEVTEVRVQRLCEISDEDARAEGVEAAPFCKAGRPAGMETCRSFRGSLEHHQRRGLMERQPVGMGHLVPEASLMCSLDYERCAAWNERTRVARKFHGCDGCGATIQPSEPYCYVSGVSDHQGWSERLCFACWWDWERFGKAHGMKPNPSDFWEALNDCVSVERGGDWRSALAGIRRRYRTSTAGRVALYRKWAAA